MLGGQRNWRHEDRKIEADISDYWLAKLPEDKQIFCDDWLRKRAVFAARLYFGFCTFFHALAPFLVGLFIERGGLMTKNVYLVHGVSLTYAVVIFALFDRRLTKIWMTYGTMQFLTNAGSTLILASCLLLKLSDMQVLHAQLVSTALLIVTLVTSPFSKIALTAAIFAQNIFMMGGVWYSHPLARDIILWYGFMGALALILQRGLVSKALREAFHEYESQKVLTSLARSHMEQELDVARKIQESMSPPARLEIGQFAMECYRQMSLHLSGHWIAVRSDGSLGVYAIICETEQHGVQGALVLHALQALWAEDLARQKFGPENWLEKANRALFVLGKKQPHVASASLIHVSGEGLTYWGAGHSGLFVLSGEDDIAPRARRAGREGIELGINEHIFLNPVRIPLSLRDKVLLGNRGTFPRGELYGVAELLNIEGELRRTVENTTVIRAESLDRLLMVISRRDKEGKLRKIREA